MTKHDFINQIRGLNLSKEEVIQLWDLYYDLEDYYTNNQEFNEELSKEIIRIITDDYSLLLELPFEESLHFVYFLLYYRDVISYYYLGDFVDEKVEDTISSIQTLCFAEVPSTYTEEMKDCFNEYILDYMHQRRNQLYHQRFEDCIYEEIYHQEEEPSFKQVEQAIQWYDELNSLDFLKEVPLIQKKLAILEIIDHHYINETWEIEDVISLAIGLCSLNQVNDLTEINDLLFKHYSDSQIPSKYKNKYYNYGLLSSVDWNLLDYQESNDLFIKQGEKYFSKDDLDSYEDGDTVWITAEEVDLYWNDLMQKEKNKSFQYGILNQGLHYFKETENFWNYFFQEDTKESKEKIKKYC